MTKIYDKWYYDENIIHLKDFDHYKKYGKFFVMRELYFGLIYLCFGKDDVYVLLPFPENVEKEDDVYVLLPFPENVEKVLEEHFKNEIRKEKIKQLENYGNKI